METSTYKTSTILVATGARTQVFRSLEEVPSGLRKRLHEITSGPNCRTLIVADKGGRDYLLRAIRRATRPDREVTAPSFACGLPAVGAWAVARKYWLEIALIGILGSASWALFSIR